MSALFMTEPGPTATKSELAIASRAKMRRELGNDLKIPGKAPWKSYSSGWGRLRHNLAALA
jgi:hypothetical protein